jgi:NitT/TauT family transport system ATP-binding protein
MIAPAPRRDIRIVFQQPVLLPWRTVLRNVLLPVDIQGLPRVPYVQRARDLLHQVGLDDFLDEHPHELSGGMQQRVGIARAVVHDPAILPVSDLVTNRLSEDFNNFDGKKVREQARSWKP